MRFRFATFLLAATFIANYGIVYAAPAALSSATPRTWTDNTGNFKTEAKLIEVKFKQVVLLKSNGRVSTVPIERLSPEDLDYVRGFAGPKLVAMLPADIKVEAVNSKLKEWQTPGAIDKVDASQRPRITQGLAAVTELSATSAKGSAQVTMQYKTSNSQPLTQAAQDAVRGLVALALVTSEQVAEAEVAKVQIELTPTGITIPVDPVNDNVVHGGSIMEGRYVPPVMEQPIEIAPLDVAPMIEHADHTCCLPEVYAEPVGCSTCATTTPCCETPAPVCETTCAPACASEPTCDPFQAEAKPQRKLLGRLRGR